MNYIVSNSYGIGDAMMTLNTIFLFEKNLNRNFTITFHQRDNEKTHFDFQHVSEIFSYFCLKPISLKCDIKYTVSDMGIDEMGENNFKIPHYKNLYFNVIKNHNVELDIEICQNRQGITSMFYEVYYPINSGIMIGTSMRNSENRFRALNVQSGYVHDSFQASRFTQKSITKHQHEKLKKVLKIKELYQYYDAIRSINFNTKSGGGREVILTNLKLINKSKKFIGSEGLWSHYSRALGVETHCINAQGRYLANMEFEGSIDEKINSISELFESQGHFLYKDFDEFYKNIEKINE